MRGIFPPLLVCLGACDGSKSGSQDTSIECVPGYVDLDGDGYVGTWGEVCQGPAPQASEDCDDQDAAVHPGTTEDCSTAADDDCDGETDAVNAVGCTPWYEDEDGDGYGTDSNVCMCAGQAPYTSDNPDDCDDADAAHNPGDQTCGLYGVVSVDLAEGKLLGEEANDWVGQSLANAGDINGDGIDDLLMGSLARTGPDGEVYAGEAYLVYGPVSGEKSLSAADVAIYSHTENDSLGISVAGPGDVDGDGYLDILLGTELATSSGESSARLLYGPFPDGAMVAEEDGLALTMLQSNMPFYVAGAGDMQGDDRADLLLGAPYADSTELQTGIAYLIDGPVSAIDDLDASAEARVLGGPTAPYYLGSAVAGGGDSNGDGVPDLFLGAYGGAGAAYLLYGPVSGTVAAEDASAIRLGEGGDIQAAGYTLAFAGDVNADGVDDLLVGAPIYGTKCAAYLLLGPITGTASLADATARFVHGDDETGTDEWWDEVGESVASAGDLDGDGRTDFIVAGGRLANVFYEPVEGTVDTSDADASLGYLPGDGLTVSALAAVANGDGNGTPGVVEGSTADSTVAPASGAAWLYLAF